MEDDRQNTPNSGELSSSDFEFGSLTPSSPSQDPFSDHSPADHLFLNGRLLPHTFPTARSVSRTTSENTFRSNSTSSRSSDSSSPTSTCNVFKITSSSTNITCFGSSTNIMSQRSETNQLKTSLILDSKKKPPMNNGKFSYLPTHCKRKNKATEIVTAQLYGSYSRRWQHITPVFQREGSVKSSSGGAFKVGGRKKKTKTVNKKKKTEERRGSKLMKWWKKILKAVVLACRECHAMEPQRLVNE